jgi:hypothetical protein
MCQDTIAITKLRLFAIDLMLDTADMYRILINSRMDDHIEQHIDQVFDLMRYVLRDETKRTYLIFRPCVPAENGK